MRLKDSVVVITGAASGIGRATALAFAGHGAAVVLVSRREQVLTELARECEQAGGLALVVAVDVTDPAAVDEVAQRAVDQFGRIDVWVNNAAVSLFATFAELPVADLRRVLEVNLMGYVHGARAALRQMRSQRAGVLVNVSSVVGVVAQPYTSAYSMSKAAIRSLSVSLRGELRLDRLSEVKVCTVLPAAIDTPLFQQAANYTGREVVPMPPVHSPERVARTIVNLARFPRREAVAGPAGRLLLLPHKLLPGLIERVFARQVDRKHLSRRRSVPPTSGNLYQPADEAAAAAEGGWRGGRRRTAVRAATLSAAGVAGGLAARRWLRARANS